MRRSVWAKRGRLFVPGGEREWSRSHAQVPTVDCVSERTWRIYYATRDSNNRSRPSYIDVEANNPEKILYEHDQPILPLGPIGAFDDCGVMPSWIVDAGAGVRYMYYIGWTVRNTVPYHNSIGLALTRDGGRTWQKYSPGPIFSPDVDEPFFTGTSCVLIEGGVWKNWYLSCVRWETIDGRPEPFYDLKYAESDDGIRWRRGGRVAVPLEDGEGGLVRASVIRERGGYRMWYAHRKRADYRTDPANSYRIGYAESSDGISWGRLDSEVGIDVSSDGWDSTMITYPHVVVGARGRKFMFYNGNGFGSTGFGYATTDEGA